MFKELLYIWFIHKMEISPEYLPWIKFSLFIILKSPYGESNNSVWEILFYKNKTWLDKLYMEGERSHWKKNSKDKDTHLNNLEYVAFDFSPSKGWLPLFSIFFLFLFLSLLFLAQNFGQYILLTLYVTWTSKSKHFHHSIYFFRLLAANLLFLAQCFHTI